MAPIVPRLDLNEYIKGNDADRKSFAKKIGNAFHTVGFVRIFNHGISQELVDTFYKRSKDFFYLPTDTKLKYLRPELAGQRGYTAFGIEHAKHSEAPDLKEFFQVGQTVTDNDPVKSQYPDNVYVEELPDFKDLSVQLYKAFEVSGNHILDAISIYLDIGESYFHPKTKNGNSILRSIYYPPITQQPKSAIRAEQHEDINLITLLVGASSGGLELLDKSNKWSAVTPLEDEIVVNVGDMLQRLTNDYLKSTTHRVVNPPEELWHEERLSIPFFLHPRKDMDLTCLPSCVNTENTLQYEPITAGEYLDERLREIGLKK